MEGERAPLLEGSSTRRRAIDGGKGGRSSDEVRDIIAEPLVLEREKLAKRTSVCVERRWTRGKRRELTGGKSPLKPDDTPTRGPGINKSLHPAPVIAGRRHRHRPLSVLEKGSRGRSSSRTAARRRSCVDLSVCLAFETRLSSPSPGCNYGYLLTVDPPA